MVQSIQPLHGGNKGHIKTLEDIRQYVDSTPALTVEDLKSWYSKQYNAPSKVSRPYINSLINSGLLKKYDDGRIECTPLPRGRNRDRRVVEIINENVVYVLEMLRDARDGKTVEELYELGTECGLTGDTTNQIQKRRGWLESAQFLERRRDGKLYATSRGQELVREHFPESVDDARNYAKENPSLAAVGQTVQDAEFGGPGEGPSHKTLKEYIHEVAARVCKARVKRRQMEYPLKSGDSVDVSAWNARKIWHIEVKSHTSNDKDIERGIYQSIKYAAAGEAEVKAGNPAERDPHSVPDDLHYPSKVESLLVVEIKVSRKLRELADKLGVRVYTLSASMRRELDELRASRG